MAGFDWSAALALGPALSGLTGGVKDLLSLLSTFQEGAERKQQLARLLWLEAQQNLLVLEALLLDEREQVESTHLGFVRACAALSTSAHVLAALTFSPTPVEREQARAEALARDTELAVLLAWAKTPVALECADGQLAELKLADLDPEAQRDLKLLREHRPATIAQAASTVATRVGALQALSRVAVESEGVLRRLRYATRLRTVRAYEHAVQRRLMELPAIQGLLPAYP